MSVVDSIVQHEGFRARPYPDPIHGWARATFGHGLTYIEEDESLDIVRRRVERIDRQLRQLVDGYAALPQTARDVLVEMAYQMGVGGVLRFRKMLDALEAGDFEHAADEMLDSRWARQTPKRAQELADKMRRALDAIG